MKAKLRVICATLLILTLILTSCGSGNKDLADEENDGTATIMDSDVPAADGSSDRNDEQSMVEEMDTQSPELEEELEEETEEETEEEEKGEIEASLFDKALLASVIFDWPDSYQMVSKEISNDSETIVTTYQKGYSKREERRSEGETTVSIYNEEEGITYDYTVGETEGSMWIDSEYDLEYLEEEKTMEGRSLLAILEEDLEEDVGIEAKRVKWLGRDAIEITIRDLDPEDEEEAEMSWSITMDNQYTVALKTEMNFGGDWNFNMEVMEIDFNVRLNDKLFERPEGISFIEN